MPEDNPIPSPQPTKKRNERTEAKFFEHVDILIAEAEREGAEYKPPNAIAKLVHLKAQRTAALAQRTVNQANAGAEETARNKRENSYKPLTANVRSLAEYAKSYGVAKNDLDALNSIARQISGRRAAPIEEGGAGKNISVSHMSYATRADNYSRFIEQYDALGIETEEDMYEADTHRAKLAEMRQANADVIQTEAAVNTSGELLDKIAFTDADSLLNGCISAKSYIKSKYKTTGEAYKNIAKTRFELPSRLRKR